MHDGKATAKATAMGTVVRENTGPLTPPCHNLVACLVFLLQDVHGIEPEDQR